MRNKILAACGCSVGLRRENNEDNFCFQGRYLPADNQGQQKILTWQGAIAGRNLFGVFDGMGGESHGETAAFLAASCAAELLPPKIIRKILPILPRARNVPKLLERQIGEMNRRICEETRRTHSRRMGSTAAVLFFEGRRGWLCNLGDSPIFRFREGCLEQLSVNHTNEESLRQNHITGRKPSLTQHLGIFPEEMILEPYIAPLEFKCGDFFLLCSDGLTDMVSRQEIGDILSRYSKPEEVARKLIDTAEENGGKDNITVITVMITGGST